MVNSAVIDIENRNNMNHTTNETPVCCFSGKPAQYYIGLSGEKELDEIRILGAISENCVETAILNVFGQGVADIRWPVILNLNGEVYYHSFQAHSKGFSAVMGWKELLANKL